MFSRISSRSLSKPGSIPSFISIVLNADVEIRDIKFGLIDNITLLDLKLEMDSDAQIVSADAERVIIRYSIWNLLSKFLSLNKNKQEDYPNGFSFPRSLIVEEGKFYWRQKHGSGNQPKPYLCLCQVVQP